jgi:hypothetical protein
VISEIQRLCPEVTILLVTTAPRWLVESYISGDFVHRPRAYDVGVLQSDSLTMDKAATLERLQQIQLKANSVIASESAFIRQNRARLVLADIPPLATSIAHAADVPCWMMSNFGWDFIYSAWGEPFAGIVDWIANQFNHCDRLFRLPFHEPMSAFPVIEDVGLTGGTPRFSPAELRSRFDLTAPTERTVLLTFGGLGLAQIPYHNLDRYPDWQFITFDRQAPALPNLLKVTDQSLRPVDFMPLCHCIVSKPGYGTFAEACRLNVPVISITREDFAEAPILLAGLRNHAHHQIVDAPEFFQGTWEFLEHPMQPPTLEQTLPTDGNQAIARAVVEYLHKDT